MNPQQPIDPHTDLEIRVVALLLGEASPFEEAQLLKAIELDPQLAAFYREMQITVGLVREVARPAQTEEAAPTSPTPKPAAQPKLSPARRAALLATLATPPASGEPRQNTATVLPITSQPANTSRWQKLKTAFTTPILKIEHPLFKLAALLLLLALLASLLLPALAPVKARSTRVAEMHRQRMLALERQLQEAEASTEAAALNNLPANEGQSLNRHSDAYGIASRQQTTPASSSPAKSAIDAPASVQFANNVYLPQINTGTKIANNAVALGDNLALAETPAVAQQQLNYFFESDFDANTSIRQNAGGLGGGGAVSARGNFNYSQSAQPQSRLDREAKDMAKFEATDNLAKNFDTPPSGPPAATPPPTQIPSSQTAFFGRQAGTVEKGQAADGSIVAGNIYVNTPIPQTAQNGAVALNASLPQQNVAGEQPRRYTTRGREIQEFAQNTPNMTANAAPQDQFSLENLARTKRREENTTLGAPLTSGGGQSRLAENDTAAGLRGMALDAALAGRKSEIETAGKTAPLASRAPVAPQELEKLAAMSGKEIEAAKKLTEELRDLKADAPPAAKPVAAPAPIVPARPAAEEPQDKRKPGPSLPPLIHQMEVQTAPNSVVNFSTFSLNVSDVAFKTAAASLQAGQWPDPNSIRIEEFINAFNYRDPGPPPGSRLAFHWEIARHPFAHQRDLLRFSIQTAALGRQATQPLNLVVLLDNSGSMGRPDRVAIVNQALMVLSDKLQPQDKISVIAFARRPQLCVDGQSGHSAKEALLSVLRLNPQGGTDLGAGMDLAYQIALKHFQPQANNRVLLLTDGAANLGDINPEILRNKVKTHRLKGIALDCFGVGWEGLDDELLELLSRNGDGRYALLNDVEQAAIEFAEKLAGALNVAAADVKTQVEFNPARVTAYRQIGYARHQLTKEQFRDNTVDAAELAAAEAGNAMYVIQVNPNGQGPLGVVRVRYRVPNTGQYEEKEWTLPYTPQPPPLPQASPAMRLAAAAALFGEYLARNPYAGEIQIKSLHNLAGSVVNAFEPDPRPRQLLTMIQQAMRLQGVQ